jgi:hypothetical protein
MEDNIHLLVKLIANVDATFESIKNIYNIQPDE